MSLSIFNAVPAGAIEVLSDANGAPHFKRADLGRFLGLSLMLKRHTETIKVQSRESYSQMGWVRRYPSQRQNDHDAFVDLDGSLEIVVRSKKPKASKAYQVAHSQGC